MHLHRPWRQLGRISSSRVWPPLDPAVSVNNIGNVPDPVSLALRTENTNKTPTMTTFLPSPRRKFYLFLVSVAVIGKSIVCDTLRGLAEACEMKVTGS